jgi:hypothetical protein
MPDQDLITFINQLSRAMWDPTAPLPTAFPGGAWGVFLVFVTQIGAGIPLGVIMARNAGLPVAVTAGLYLASDVVLAFTMEPMLIGLRWLGQRVELIGRLGTWLSRFSGATGLKSEGVRGPLGLILFSFTVSPTAGRAASEAAGHGFFSGWSLAIIGDMAYFGLIMATTLWISSIFGDDRVTIGAILLATWLLPMLIRRMRRAQTAPVPVTSRPVAVLQVADEGPRPPRRSIAHNGRRRRSGRGLHR